MKRILASLLCLILVLSMALAFVACDGAAGTLPGPGADTPVPDQPQNPTDNPGDTTKSYTEEDAKVALAAMTAQLGTKKNFAADLTLTVGTKQNGVNGSIEIPVSIEADTEAPLYHASITIPGAIMSLLDKGNSALTCELYLTHDGLYVGTDGDVTDDLGNPVMAYRYEPGITTDTLAEIIAWLMQDDSGADTPDTDGGTTENPTAPEIPGLDTILPGFTARPKTELKLVDGENGGYLLTASVDVKDLLNVILSMMQNLLQVSPKTIAAQYLTGEVLATIGEMTVSDVLTLIDGYIGAEMTDTILEIVMDALASATTETDGEGDGAETPEVSEVRAAFLSMFGDSKVIQLILGFVAGDDDSAPAYDPDMTEEEMVAFYEALAGTLLEMIPDEEIGKMTVPGTEMTIGDLLKGVAFTDCHASVTFSLTDAYLPTAVTAEAAVALRKAPKATYAYTVTAAAALSFEANVTLPEEMPVLPEEDTYIASAEGDNLTVSVSYFSNDFKLASATIVYLNGEAADIKAVIDEVTQTITFTGIPQAYVDGEEQIMTFDIEVVFTRTVGERTYTYTMLRTERYQPTNADA